MSRTNSFAIVPSSLIYFGAGIAHDFCPFRRSALKERCDICSGVLISGSAPSAAQRSRISGNWMILDISMCRPIDHCRGVPAGASMPYRTETS